MLQQHIRVEEEREENDSEENVISDKDWSLSEGRVNCNCLLRLSIKTLCVI